MGWLGEVGQDTVSRLHGSAESRFPTRDFRTREMDPQFSHPPCRQRGNR